MPFQHPHRIFKRISIHALRVEGDCAVDFSDSLFYAISIHALRVEGDLSVSIVVFSPVLFLSTPSGWRATFLGCCRHQYLSRFLSTPSGWRATRAMAE